MKYIISEEQNDRIKQIIKYVAETYTNNFVVKTEVEVEEAKDAAGETYYKIYPKFYVKGMMGPDFSYTKHLLAQFVEDMVGVPIYSASARIKNIDDI